MFNTRQLPVNVYEIGNYLVYPVVIVYAAVFFAAIKNGMVRTVVTMFIALATAVVAFGVWALVFA